MTGSGLVGACRHAVRRPRVRQSMADGADADRSGIWGCLHRPHVSRSSPGISGIGFTFRMGLWPRLAHIAGFRRIIAGRIVRNMTMAALRAGTEPRLSIEVITNLSE